MQTDHHLFTVDLEEFRGVLQRNGEKLDRQRSAVERTLEVCRQAALTAMEQGISERECARLLGVSIPTIRKWQGKK